MFASHRELLQIKGYDETTLKNNGIADRLVTRLQINLSKCICKAISDKTTTSFFLSTVGFFNDNSDVVLFRFHYQYDPVKKQLHLKSLAAKMDDSQKIFFLLNSSCLPSSHNVYSALSNARKMRLAKLVLRANSVYNDKRLRL